VVPLLLRSGDVTHRQVLAWRALANGALEPNPFFEPEYVLALARHDYGGEITLLTVQSGTDMVALLPMYRRQLQWRGFPLPIWSVPNVLGTPLVIAGHAEPALELAFDFLSRQSVLRKILLVPRVPVDGPVAVAIHRALRDRMFPCGSAETVRSPVVWRRAENNYLDETLHGSRRKHVRSQRSHLDRLLGQSLRLVDRTTSPDAVEKFLVLEASGWKGRAGTAMLCKPAAANWFRQVCAAYAAAGRLRLLSLEAGGTTVAMKCDVTAGGGLFNLKTAYEESFARFSPGVLLEIEAVRVFHEEKQCTFMDASTNYPKNPLVWLYPEGRLLADRAFALGGRATRAVMGGLVSSRRVIGSVNRFLRRDRGVESSNPPVVPSSPTTLANDTATHRSASHHS